MPSKPETPLGAMQRGTVPPGDKPGPAERWDAESPHTVETMKSIPEYVTRWRSNHHAALAALHVNPEKADGLKMWRKLRSLENRARAIAMHYCNGTGGITTANVEEKTAPIRAAVAQVFGGKLPPGFRVNYDARGSALKIDPERGPVPQGMQTDMGGNGILAAEINP